MEPFLFDNILDVMNKFDEYKIETRSRWRKIDTRGPLFLCPGKETFDCVDHATLRAPAKNVRYLNWSKLSVVNDGIPYVPVGKHVYSCYYGRDPGRASRERKSNERLERLSEEERASAIMNSSRDKSMNWNDMLCPAKVRLSYIIKFPGMKIESPRERSSVTHLFDKLMKTNPEAIEMKNMYILQLPVKSSHLDHPIPCPDADPSHPAKCIDRTMLQAAEWYSFISGQERPMPGGHMTLSSADNNFENGIYEEDISNSMDIIETVPSINDETSDSFDPTSSAKDEPDIAIVVHDSSPEYSGARNAQYGVRSSPTEQNEQQATTMTPTSSETSMNDLEMRTGCDNSVRETRNTPDLVGIGTFSSGITKKTMHATSRNTDAVNQTLRTIDEQSIVNQNSSRKRTHPADSPIALQSEEVFDSSPNALQKTRKVITQNLTDYDEDDLFLLSITPRLKTLPRKKASEVKIKVMQLLHEAEFGT